MIEVSRPFTVSVQGGQQVFPFWPNWPIMNTCLVQGASLTDTALVPPDHAADKDMILFQSFDPTITSRMTTRVAAMSNIRAQQDPAKMLTRFFQYLTPCVTYKVNPNTDSNEREFNRELIDDPVNGNPNWIVKRVTSGTPCETLFAPTTDLQTNITVGAGLNSLGESYAKAYFKKYDNAWTTAYKAMLSGIFHDVFNQRPATLFINNGATAINDPDYDLDGIADPRENFSVSGPGNGGRQWALGGLNTKAEFEARFPGKFMIPNGARWEFDYFDGVGAPPLPLGQAPFYRKFEFVLDESAHLNLSLTPTGTGWTVSGTPGATGRYQAFFRAYHICEKFLKLDVDISPLIGKGAYLFQTAGNDRAPTSDDIEAMRFLSLSALLVDRGAPCVQPYTNRLWSLDELLLELGAPLALRSMGTLDETTLAFAIRAADFSNGVARFYWARFAKGIVLCRGDTPTNGAYPSADAAISCTLPTPPAGMKYQRINSATYINPVTGRAMRGQDTTLNSGADATTVSLKPLHAMALRLVAA